MIKYMQLQEVNQLVSKSGEPEKAWLNENKRYNLYLLSEGLLSIISITSFKPFINNTLCEKLMATPSCTSYLYPSLNSKEQQHTECPELVKISLMYM